MDKDTDQKVRKIAAEGTATSTAAGRKFHASRSSLDDQAKEAAVKRIQRTFDTMSRDLGCWKWSRQELHKR